MTDRSAEIAALIRRYPRADRLSLLQGILDRWPDITADELQRAIDAATQRPRETRLQRALEPAARKRA